MLYNVEAKACCGTIFTASSPEKAADMHTDHHNGRERRAAAREAFLVQNDAILAERYGF